MEKYEEKMSDEQPLVEQNAETKIIIAFINDISAMDNNK